MGEDICSECKLIEEFKNGLTPKELENKGAVKIIEMENYGKVRDIIEQDEYLLNNMCYINGSCECSIVFKLDEGLYKVAKYGAVT